VGFAGRPMQSRPEGAPGGILWRAERVEDSDKEGTMARVRYLTTTEAQGDARKVLAQMEERGLAILNLHRALANSPDTLRNFMRLGNSMLFHGVLSPALRELAILRIAQMTGADYEWAHHVPIARQVGISEEQIAGLKGWHTSPYFDERQRAALRYAESVTSLATVPDDVFREVRAHLSEAEVVEMTLVAGYWGMVARLLVVLKIDVEPSFAQYLPSV
jgi:4-carboxymuconolactone decarboxylase